MSSDLHKTLSVKSTLSTILETIHFALFYSYGGVLLITQQFKTTIEKTGTRTFIAIPFNPNDVWGVKQRHHITGTVNGCKIRGSIGSDGQTYFLPLGAAWRRDNGLDAGADVEVMLSPEGPQTDLLAPDISSALEAEPQARAFFEALPTFYRNNFVRWIASAKKPETRAAHIKEMMELLKAGKRQK
jgi:hypothetical protein